LAVDLYKKVKRCLKEDVLRESALDELIYSLIAFPSSLFQPADVVSLLTGGISRIRPITAARLLSKQVKFVESDELVEDLFGQFFSDRRASMNTIITAAHGLWSRGKVHSHIGLRLLQRLIDLPADSEMIYVADTNIFTALSILNTMNYTPPSNVMSSLVASLSNGLGSINPNVYIDMLALIALNPGPWDISMHWFKKEAVNAVPRLDGLLKTEQKHKAYMVFAIWAARGHEQSAKLARQISGVADNVQQPKKSSKGYNWCPPTRLSNRMQQLATSISNYTFKNTIVYHPSCDFILKGVLGLIYAEPTIQDMHKPDKLEYTVMMRLKFALLDAMKIKLKIIQSHDFLGGGQEKLARDLLESLKHVTI
jgi:hypothetical protein